LPLVKILFFAQVQERLGQPMGSYMLPDSISADAILAYLSECHPEVAQLLPRCRVALDQAFVRGPLTLTETSELAVIPPVSGG
jgi:molybdopterin converting factor subunit 1